MTALVVGAARSGVALAQHLTRRGERVRLTDRKQAADLTSTIRQLPAGVELCLGGHEGALDGVDVVYASPGVPWDSELLEEARAKGIRVSSEIELFLELCRGTVVGITGTNGKTTTTALAGDVLAAGTRPVIVGGNIGDTVLDRVDEITPEHWVVLELSSFQLESVARPRLYIGAVLNITPDHLDRHKTFDRYVDMKAKAIEHSDYALLNSRDPIVKALAARATGKVVWFDQHKPAPPMPLPGRHNMDNALAAAAIGRIGGLSDEVIEEAIRNFKGVAHRLELVGEWKGVRWYNDSKATNPDAGRVALASFPGVPLILIAGGYGGGFDLAGWVGDVLEHVEAVVLMGASADELAHELRHHPRVVRAATLEEAVSEAERLSHPGAAVLLSPAYKSFDMFRDFEERGDQFKAIVRRRFAA